MKYRIIFLVIVMLFVNGLDNYVELNELAIVSSISIDKEGENKYNVSVQILNSKKEFSGSKSGSSSSEITVYESSAETVQEALRDLSKESPKKLYLSHMKMLIIDEEIAKEGISPSLDFFLRDIKSNKEILIVIASENTEASKIIKVQTPIETNPTKNLQNSIYVSYNYMGNTIKSFLSTIVSDLIDDGIELTIASAKIEGDVEIGEKKENVESAVSEAKILVGKIAYFKKDKLKGYLSDEDCISYNMINNEIKNTIIQDKINEIEAAIEIIEFKSSTKPKFINNNFEVDIKVELTANIAEMTEKNNISTSKDLEKIQSQIQNIIKERLEKYIYNVKNVYESDIIGFGKMFNKYLNKEYTKVKDVFYDEYFKNIICNIDVKVDLENEGGIVKEW